MKQLILFCLLVKLINSQIIGNCITTSGFHGQCKALISCVVFSHEISTLQRQPCSLAHGEKGVCCPHISFGPAYTVGYVTYLKPPKPPSVSFPNDIKPSVINNALSVAKELLDKRSELEKNLITNGFIIHSGTSTFKHHRNQRTSSSAKTLGFKATQLNEASKQISKEFNLTPRQSTFGLPKVEVNGSDVRNELCENAMNSFCNESTLTHNYRSLDGSCNNVENPGWGARNAPLSRLLSPEYEDGLAAPRGGDTLPSPRTISDVLIHDRNTPSREYTLLLMQWGQFLDHDIVHTPLVQGKNKEEIKCCKNGRRIEGEMKHPECFPIPISKTDSFYSLFDNECMEFVRSMPALREECNLGPREQVNQVTSFLDGSTIYGSDLEEVSKLRLGQFGRLRITRYGTDELLPLAPDECQDSSSRESCFDAGDGRVNEQPQLTVMHTIWVREHNRLTTDLASLNPHWNDERLFQEARKIVGAMIQHISYNEWLPLIIGKAFMDKERLFLLSNDYSYEYDYSLNPTVTNSFATAAFRFGHSLVQGFMEWYNVFGQRLEPLQLHHHQFQPFQLYEIDAIDNFIRGLTVQSSQDFDASVSIELTQHLFQGNESDGKGMDLISLNIQRGRDHGLPPYLEYRRLCGLSEIRTWKEFSRIVALPELVPRLQRLYSSIADIDLFVGGIIEKKAESNPYGGGILGDTFQCLIGDQFKRLKLGDRFWYENSKIFTSRQLQEIRKITMARILCDTGKFIHFIQPFPFKSTFSYMNELVACEGASIPKLNIEPWRE